MASIVRPSVFSLKQGIPSVARSVLGTPTARAPLATPVRLAPLQLRKTDAVVGLAGFHATCRKEILKPPPQVVHGTTDDPAPIPPPSPPHGSYHWTFERVVAASLIPLTIAPFAGGSFNPVMDAVLCGTLIIHSHVGFQACITDYFPGYRVPRTKSLLKWTLRAATLTAAVGLYEFETNDVGLTQGIKRVWSA